MRKQTTHITFGKKVQMKNAHKTPVNEISKEGWVQFGNDVDWRNTFPDYLIELFNRSPKHNGIVTSKHLYMCGMGWNDLSWQPNPDEGINEWTAKLLFDFEVFDGLFNEVIPNKLLTKVAEYRHLPFQKIRSNYNGKKFYFAENWKNVSRLSETVQFERYIPGRTKFEKGKRYIYFYRTWRPGANVYPLPNYMGALSHIETDCEIGNYNLNEIKNNFNGGKLVSIFGGIPSQEERQKFEKQFNADFTGTDEAGRFIFTWSDTRERNVEVLPLQGDDLDKRYIELNKQLQQDILTVHKIISPLLFGIKTEGQLGGNQELVSAYELFKNTYVDPRRKPIVEAINQLAKAAGYTGTLEIVELRPVAPEQVTPAPAPATATAPVAQKKQKFTDDHKKLLSLFSKYGMSRDGLEVLETNYAWMDLLGDKPNNTVIKLAEKVALMEFATKISDLEAAVLDYLNKDALTPASSIAASLNVDVTEVQDAITKLIEAGYLKKSDNGFTLTTTGSKVLDNNLPATSETFIVYHYDVAPGLGELVMPTTRDFCRELIGMNKVWTRTDIENISQEYGYSVWELRGGFYHNPKTDETTPYCRHIWTQQIVTKRS